MCHIQSKVLYRNKLSRIRVTSATVTVESITSILKLYNIK